MINPDSFSVEVEVANRAFKIELRVDVVHYLVAPSIDYIGCAFSIGLVGAIGVAVLDKLITIMLFDIPNLILCLKIF